MAIEWNKKTKTIFWVSAGVIMLIILILLFTSKKAKADNPSSNDESKAEEPKDTKGNNEEITQASVSKEQVTSDDFPLKKGKKGKRIEQAQIYTVKKYGAQYPTFGIDGKWGSETEANMLKWLKKNTISQDFFLKAGMDKIKTSVFK